MTDWYHTSHNPFGIWFGGTLLLTLAKINTIWRRVQILNGDLTFACVWKITERDDNVNKS